MVDYKIRSFFIFLYAVSCVLMFWFEGAAFWEEKTTVELCSQPPLPWAWDLSDNSSINIPISFDVWGAATTAYQVKKVFVDITHTFAADLWAKLMSPDKTQIRLWQLGDGSVRPTNWASECDKWGYNFSLSDEEEVALLNTTEKSFCVWKNYDTLVSWRGGVSSPYVFSHTHSKDQWIQWTAKPIDPLNSFVWDSVFGEWILNVSDDYSKDFWTINEVCLGLAFGWVELFLYISNEPTCSDKKEQWEFINGERVYVCAWVENKWTEEFSLEPGWAKNDFWLDFSSLERVYTPRGTPGDAEHISHSFIIWDNTDFPEGTYIFNASGKVKWASEFFTPDTQLTTRKNVIFEVVPKELPVLTFVWDENEIISVWDEYTDSGVVVDDPVDGSKIITWEWIVDTTTAWIYPITYSYINSDGHEAKEIVRFVTVEDISLRSAEEKIIEPYSLCKKEKHLVCTSNSNWTDVYVRKIWYQCIDGDLWKPCDQLELYNENFSQKSTKEKTSEGQIKKTRNINNIWTDYYLKKDYLDCKIIDTILDEWVNALWRTELLDISHLNDKKHIARLESVGIINGTKEWRFEPNRDISRVEFLKIVLRAHCIEYRDEDTSTINFTDTIKWSWQSKVIKRAYDLGIIHWSLSGSWERVFRENDTISKIEATKILFRMSLIDSENLQKTRYTDINEDWHKKYIAQGEMLWVFNSQEEKFIFDPDKWISRKEMVQFLYKTIRLYR